MHRHTAGRDGKILQLLRRRIGQLLAKSYLFVDLVLLLIGKYLKDKLERETETYTGSSK